MGRKRTKKRPSAKTLGLGLVKKRHQKCARGNGRWKRRIKNWLPWTVALLSILASLLKIQEFRNSSKPQTKIEHVNIIVIEKLQNNVIIWPPSCGRY